MNKVREYLGDSVYVWFDGYHIVLETDNGYGASNTIALEPSVLSALKRYEERIIHTKEPNDERRSV